MTSLSARGALAKVPAVTAFFWIIKILSTTVGETFADFLNSNLGLGLGNTALVMSGVLVIVLTIQMFTRRYRAGIYWLTIVVISTVGTLITDNLHDGFGVSNVTSILVFASALLLTFWIWFRREGTLEMKSINTPIREGFYWLAILFTFALGTAGGDVFLDDLGIPLTTTLLGFAAVIALVGFVWRLRWLGSVAAFWIAYVLTRPLGAALGDLLSLPKSETGLGLGATTTSIVFLGLIGSLVIYLSLSKKDQIK